MDDVTIYINLLQQKYDLLKIILRYRKLNPKSFFLFFLKKKKKKKKKKEEKERKYNNDIYIKIINKYSTLITKQFNKFFY